MKHREYLSTLYNGYRERGHKVFIVTLTSFVKSKSYAQSTNMYDYWENVFIRRIRKHLPFKMKSKIDYDFVIELSPNGHYHYHGFIVAPQDVAAKIYPNNCLNRNIVRDLARLNKEEKYRTHKIKKFEIKPAENIDQWANYITKTSNYIH